MDHSKMMSDILARAASCPACGKDNAPDASKCASCGASLRADDPTVSVVSAKGATPPPTEEPAEAVATPPQPRPLETSKTYTQFKKYLDGIHNKTASESEVLAHVKRMKNLADSALLLFNSALLKHKMKKAKAGERKLTRELVAGIELLKKGMVRLEKYFTTHDAEDLEQGTEQAEAGFVAVGRLDRLKSLPLTEAEEEEEKLAEEQAEAQKSPPPEPRGPDLDS